MSTPQIQGLWIKGRKRIDVTETHGDVVGELGAASVCGAVARGWVRVRFFSGYVGIQARSEHLAKKIACELRAEYPDAVITLEWPGRYIDRR